MAEYTHGIYIDEKTTQLPSPIISSVQVVFGTAPVNLAEDITKVVNKPIICKNFEEAKAKLGYSEDFENYTLCQSMYASLNLFKVAPVVFINVLDPAIHKTTVAPANLNITNKKIIVEQEGILINNALIIKSEDGTTTYQKTSDYVVAFNDSGYPVISIVSTGQIPSNATVLKVGFDKLNPSGVQETDIIGGYDSLTGIYTGIELIEQIYPIHGQIPSIVSAPGWSHNPNVAAILQAKMSNINGGFKGIACLDVDTSEVLTYDAVETWKNTNLYTDKHAILCWPMVKVGEKKIYMSAQLSALLAYVDFNNDGVPYVSPSNKDFKISSTILVDGTEVFLDQPKANYLNGKGVLTALNMNGWKSWGNNTAAYPENTDPKDRWIPCRRMFNWQGNNFISIFASKVDNPTNIRLIEAIVDDENIRANGFKAKNQIADMKITFSLSENPLADIIDGKIIFKQYFTPFPPAETIINVLEFDPNAIISALGGA